MNFLQLLPQIVLSFEIINPIYYLAIFMGHEPVTFQLSLLLTVLTVWNGLSAETVVSSETLHALLTSLIIGRNQFLVGLRSPVFSFLAFRVTLRC